MNDRLFYDEREAKRPVSLTCPFCRTPAQFQLRWLERRKKPRPPSNLDERGRAQYQKAQSYMVLLEDKVACMRCRKRFDVSGIKTMAYLYDLEGLPKDVDE